MAPPITLNSIIPEYLARRMDAEIIREPNRGTASASRPVATFIIFYRADLPTIKGRAIK